MATSFRVRVFGKAGCAKCKTLNQRLDKLLARDEWSDFEKEYCALDTEEGMVEFCGTECINPQRVPAMLVMRREGDSGDYEPMANAAPGEDDGVCGKSRLYQFLGIQTDYSGRGKGVISPKMIESLLRVARG